MRICACVRCCIWLFSHVSPYPVWQGRGNPFAARALDDPALEHSDGNSSGLGAVERMKQLSSAPTASQTHAHAPNRARDASMSDDAVDCRERELKAYACPWTITTASLNGIGRTIARYMQVMVLLPYVCADAVEGIHELVRFYTFNVFTLFTPLKSIKALFHVPTGGHKHTHSHASSLFLEPHLPTKSSKGGARDSAEASSDEDEEDASAAESPHSNHAHTLLSTDERMYSRLRSFMVEAYNEQTHRYGHVRLER